MGHFEGRDDTQVYVGDDGKVYDTPAEEKVLAESVDAFFGGNGKKPDTPKPTVRKKKSRERGPDKKPRRFQKDRFEMVNCPICDKSVKKGAGLSHHMRMAHPEEK